MTLTFGYSPCPNDTYAFHAAREGLVGDVEFDVRHHDVETLNEKAQTADLDVSKLSFGGFAHVLEDYALLRSGAALGRGVGPIVVADEDMDPSRLSDPDVDVAIPGELTTAHLLLQLHSTDFEAADALRFDEIMPSVACGDYDAGLVIHEGRFTYRDYGLSWVLDLGRWWELETGDPVPLGGIAVRRDVDTEVAEAVENQLRLSVERALSRPQKPMEYVREHADEMADDVVQRHIDLYVNDFTVDMGEEGVSAVETLIQRGVDAGLLEDFSDDVMAVR